MASLIFLETEHQYFTVPQDIPQDARDFVSKAEYDEKWVDYPLTSLLPLKSVTTYDMYFVDKNGNIWSEYVKRFLSPVINKRLGYCYIMLRSDGKRINHRLHRLVAQTYLPNPENKSEVNHIDGNKVNNSVDNLEWCTASENQRHSVKIGLKNMPKGEEHYMFGRTGKKHWNSKQLIQIDILTKDTIKTWDCLKDVQRELGFYIASISRCCLGQQKTAYGFNWEYVK